MEVAVDIVFAMIYMDTLQVPLLTDIKKHNNDA